MSPNNKQNEDSNSRVDNIDKHVSKQLRARRMQLGLSQQSLGDEVGVSVQQIQKYERAHNRISSGKLYHFSNFLGVSIDYFFDGIKHKTEQHIFAENVNNTSIDGVSERDVLLLIRAYNSISNPEVRKKLLEFVRSISEE